MSDKKPKKHILKAFQNQNKHNETNIIDTYNANNVQQNIPIFNSQNIEAKTSIDSDETEFATVSKYDMEECSNATMNNAYNMIELLNRPKTYEELLLERDKLTASICINKKTDKGSNDPNFININFIIFVLFFYLACKLCMFRLSLLQDKKLKQIFIYFH